MLKGLEGRCTDNVNGIDMSITSRNKNLVINQDTIIKYRAVNLCFIDFHFTVSNASEDCKLWFTISNQIYQEVLIFFAILFKPIAYPLIIDSQTDPTPSGTVVDPQRELLQLLPQAPFNEYVFKCSQVDLCLHLVLVCVFLHDNISWSWTTV